MKIDVKWERPLRLRIDAQQNVIYKIAGLERLPKKACVYVFVRMHGQTVEPLYIGQATRLRSRIKEQLNNVALMQQIKKASAGHRFLLVGRLKLHPGQQESKVLEIVEKALIKRALAEGYDIFNKQGTKTPVHEIRSRGNKAFRKLMPTKMLAERK
jgi:hypothetical protein